jgi:hypothetical protein
MFLCRIADSHPTLSDLARWLSNGQTQVLNTFWPFIKFILGHQVFDLFYNICSFSFKYFALFCFFDILDHLMPILIKFRSQENVIVIVIIHIHPLENTQVNRFSLWRLNLANFDKNVHFFRAIHLALGLHILHNII